MLDKDKGGHFTVSPAEGQQCTTKQHYLPSSNILQTRYLHEDGVMNLVDFFPRPNNKTMDAEFHASVLRSKHRGEVLNERDERPDLKKWLVRRVECMRGEIDVDVELFPAFSKHILLFLSLALDRLVGLKSVQRLPPSHCGLGKHLVQTDANPCRLCTG
jgi:GH15 family glucan-1,4-alpha-glucosidase